MEPTEGVEIRTQIDEDLVASGDPVLLRQVLIGLLTNACKNTPAPGAVTLRASREEGGTVTIEVEDTGKGIPAVEQGPRLRALLPRQRRAGERGLRPGPLDREADG